jgi:serpin B
MSQSGPVLQRVGAERMNRTASSFVTRVMTRALALAVLLALGLAACGGSPRSTEHPAPRSELPPRSEPAPRSQLPPLDATNARAFGSASNAFGLDVWGRLRSQYATGNVAISPASITTALAMTYGGARGETATAMADAMHFSSSPEDTMRAAGRVITSWNDPARTSYELAVANRLYGASSYAFDSAYLAATRDAFGAELQRVDFADADPVRALINQWVSDRTHARISELMPSGSISADTRLVLVNAVYFHGRWAVPFARDMTYDDVFHAPTGDVSVPTMHRSDGGAYGEDEGVKLLELGYAGDELSMLFVVPEAVDGLAAVEDRLDAALVDRWAGRVQPVSALAISLPRFRIETDAMSLRAALSSLGMGIAFTGAADFSGMAEAGQEGLQISDVVHRVFVELNEEGTEAAGATGVTMVDTTADIGAPPRIVVDRPFLFFLRDRATGAILFAGHVVDPR